MSEEYSNIDRIVIGVWGVVGKNYNADKSRRFFKISGKDDNNSIHLLAYGQSSLTPTEVFWAFHDVNVKNSPFLEVVETPQGDAVFMYHGSWSKSPNIASDTPVVFKLSSGDPDIVRKFENKLKESAIVLIKEFFKGDPKAIYEGFIREYEKWESRSDFNKSFMVSGTFTASFMEPLIKGPYGKQTIGPMILPP